MAVIGVRGWVFDLDGTLTVAQHDFAGIKRRLGLPADLPVLEGIAARPLDQRQGLLDAVAAWEEALADQARQSPGAHALLSALAAAGTPIGVLTRNARPTALRTLRAAGLEGFIPDDRVLGRDEAAP
ncbi:MAG: HAD family hydrolase [Myxococcota bacterium]